MSSVRGDVSKIDTVLAEHEKFKQAELERGEAILAEAMNSVRDLIDCGPNLESLDYAIYKPSRFTSPDPDRIVHEPFPDEDGVDQAGLWDEDDYDRQPWEPDERLWRMSNGLVLRNVHAAQHCFGRACVLHNPSTHHMRFWSLGWRDDTGVFERRCAHGIGHPDPDQFEYWERVGQDWKSVHGCDGCCRA